MRTSCSSSIVVERENRRGLIYVTLRRVSVLIFPILYILTTYKLIQLVNLLLEKRQRPHVEQVPSDEQPGRCKQGSDHMQQLSANTEKATNKIRRRQKMNVTWLFCVQAGTVKLSNECQYTVRNTVPCTGRIFS